MTTLIAGGDSFTWGSELPDSDGSRYSRLSWSALLAKRKGMNYKCVAKAGSGNESMMRRVVDAVSKDRDCFVAVMWTYPIRLDIHLNQMTFEIMAKEFPAVVPDGWMTLSSWDSIPYEEKIERFAIADEGFRQHIRRQSQIKDQIKASMLTESFFELSSGDHLRHNTVSSILSLQAYLEKLQIPYLFSAVSDQVYQCLDDSFDPLTEAIDRSKWVGNGQGMLEWGKERNYPLTPMLHLPAEAHRAWIDAFIQ